MIATGLVLFVVDVRGQRVRPPDRPGRVLGSRRMTITDQRPSARRRRRRRSTAARCTASQHVAVVRGAPSSSARCRGCRTVQPELGPLDHRHARRRTASAIYVVVADRRRAPPGARPADATAVVTSAFCLVVHAAGVGDLDRRRAGHEPHRRRVLHRDDARCGRRGRRGLARHRRHAHRHRVGDADVGAVRSVHGDLPGRVRHGTKLAKAIRRWST